ncbi:MarR family transcriptional regulator [Paralcaligenes sp. KSB-10]|uniref:MarR family transcriptional regulator n=1 Tax=Paralcaligenes sp. KSB-10 TaxID=2901142 RepID=UPI001E28C3CE|nr:helix-turn-helix domain-containing protein [Paralcaligenes sp. KSB-10]UHL62661.1 MarR family transcriptional regulator [Paralcaligenes sp. KSB-10]
MTTSNIRALDAVRQLNSDDYKTLATFRYALRRFIVFSETAAVSEGLAPQQHQALLAIKAMPEAPSVGDIAERLMIRHHSAVELVGRLVRMGLVERLRDLSDRRRVRVSLTPLAEHKLADLSAAHLEELRAIRPLLAGLLKHFDN